MPEVQTVFVQIEEPKGDFKGRVAEGCYTVENDTLTLTNRHGDPVRDVDGRTWTYKLETGDNHRQVAGLLTKKFRKARRGSNATPDSFSRRINYPKTGWL